MKNITATVNMEINAPASSVWEAITTPELIKKYFFGTEVHSDWQVGSPITFTGTWQGKSYEDKGTILEIIPNKTFRHTYWSSMSGIEEKPENYVPITYTLKEINDGTMLTVTQENIPDEKMKTHSEENWNKVLKGLKDLVEGTAVNA
jgi:uncharacterized protein YndB with AHSA1/START domain